MIRKLARIPYGSARVEIGNSAITLWSYDTPVAVIDGDWLHVNGLYSATTRKHISAFMAEYGRGRTYADAKACVEKGHDLNLVTGAKRIDIGGGMKMIV